MIFCTGTTYRGMEKSREFGKTLEHAGRGPGSAYLEALFQKLMGGTMTLSLR